MELRIQQFSAAQLKTLIVHEMRKFASALEYGSTISDLHEIKEHLRSLLDTLTLKEEEDIHKIAAEFIPQSKR
ncbi:hypothetical protein A4H97_25510 [Niastella yeongjuensis]|uniref:Uncharacterized protein n=1 Tax=Niastella yeongjuensis TaxID=354355 RepID=A0A1V9F0U2_9BACT|nr:hypothetical protein [Niastella yeongjuensis]OQP51979.1 hypothetical protein A4H97_25510 [Niastella yeongjuensis]SEP36011.1 hypothetical protein SAMN05660816_05445 [Niastella yeongjuensis]